MRGAAFDNPHAVIEWHRLGDFQRVTLLQICRAILPRDVRAFFLNTYHEVELVFPDHYRTVAAGFLFLRFMVPAVFN